MQSQPQRTKAAEELPHRPGATCVSALLRLAPMPPELQQNRVVLARAKARQSCNAPYAPRARAGHGLILSPQFMSPGAKRVFYTLHRIKIIGSKVHYSNTQFRECQKVSYTQCISD